MANNCSSIRKIIKEDSVTFCDFSEPETITEKTEERRSTFRSAMDEALLETRDSSKRKDATEAEGSTPSQDNLCNGFKEKFNCNIGVKKYFEEEVPVANSSLRRQPTFKASNSSVNMKSPYTDVKSKYMDFIKPYMPQSPSQTQTKLAILPPPKVLAISQMPQLELPNLPNNNNNNGIT